MPTLNWLGREKMTDDLRQVALRILREDPALSHRAVGLAGEMPHAEDAEAGRAALVAAEGCTAGGKSHAENAESAEGRGVLGERSDEANQSFLSTQPLRSPRSLREEKTHEARVAREMPHAESAEGILVHGDNLEALKALLPFYAGEVKCIYIDPPYNTGSAFEHYDDNLEHATWLNMMYPRLKLLREFLREDGSIWISIDDREGAYLRVICDEIFGRQNFVSNISWQRNYSVKGDSKGIVTSAEHILVYSKREGWQPNKLARTEEMDGKYKNPDNDPNGPWRSDNPYASDANTHQGMVYAIQHPFTGELLYPTMSSHWRYSQDEMLRHMNGWSPYELREIDDAEKRAAICGVGVDEVRKGVKAILLKEFSHAEGCAEGKMSHAENAERAEMRVGGMPHAESAEDAERSGALGVKSGGASRLNHSFQPLRSPRSPREEKNVLAGACFQTGLTGLESNPVNPVNPVKKRSDGAAATSAALPCVADAMNCVPPESRKMAMAVLKKGPWPKFFFSKNGQGGIARKTYLSAVGGVPPTNLWLHQDVGHTDEAKKEVLKVFDGQSPFATPKPERLIRRVLEIATDAGDLVLDSFLGSGTTAAVAHKMGRRWIGIEMGDHARTHCAVRMRKVVDGEPGGISKAVKWQGGGGFRFYELGEPILKPDGTLTADIPFEVMAAHVWWRETGTPWTGFFNTEPSLRDGATGASREDGSARSANAPCASRASAPEVLALCKGANRSTESREANLPVASDRPAKRLCVEKSPVLGVHGGVAYALLYNGILHDRRVNGGNVLTRKTLALIREDLGRAECDRLIVYGEATRLMRETLTAEKIEFRQTPYDLVLGR